MSWVWIFFTLGLFWTVSEQLLPLTTKQDGSVDMSILVNHITRMEQTVTEFQKKTTQLETDLQVTKSDLQTTKTDLKDQQRRSDAEISSLKGELAAVKAEVVMTSDELISTRSEVANLKTTFLSLEASMNQTVLDSISHDVKTNMADIKSVKHALEMTNSSVETFVTEISNFNRNSTATTTELQKQQKDVKSAISNLSSTLAQIQSNVTFTVSDFYHIKHSVMVVQTQLNTTTSDFNLIKSDVANIRRNVSDLETMSQSVKQISQILQTTNVELETTKFSLQDQQNQSTSIHNSINNELQTIKSDLALKTKTVAFNVRMSSDGHTISVHEPVKFEYVQYNAGNGYNRTTGKFTAPVSGTYMFYVQVELYDLSKAQNTYIRIMKSGSLMAGSYGKSSPASIDDVTVSVTAVMYVGQGDEVWVEPKSNVQIYQDRYDGTHFGGALVSAK